MEFVRTLKALADPLRLRILAAVSEEELTVGEVQEVVDSVQSAVSRNLAILREAGFVQDRKEGTSVYFSARQPMPEPAREVFQSLQAGLAGIPEVKHDQMRLAETKRRRLRRSRSYFESVAGDWERIRRSYFDDRVTSLAIEKLLPQDLILADIGCGTGSLTLELARFAGKVIGVDLSQEMFAAGSRRSQRAEPQKRRVSSRRYAEVATGCPQRRCRILRYGFAFFARAGARHRWVVPHRTARRFGDFGRFGRARSKHGCASRWRTSGWASSAHP